MPKAQTFDDNAHEYRAYQQKAITRCGDKSYDHLARCYGFVETDLGKALETDLIMMNGDIAPTLKQYLKDHGLTRDVKIALEEFEIWLRKTMILTKHILPHNVVIAKRPNGSLRLVIIDGIGCQTFIPLASFSKYFAKRYVDRRIERMWKRIEWELSKDNTRWRDAKKL